MFVPPSSPWFVRVKTGMTEIWLVIVIQSFGEDIFGTGEIIEFFFH